MCICTLLLAKVVFPLEQIPETECGNMTKTTETMGMRIRARRKALGFTQQYLAEILWVKEETISNYENDKVDIKGSVICKLAELLETTPDFLLTGKVMDFNDKERELISLFKSLPAELQEVAIGQMVLLEKIKKVDK